MEWTTFQKAIFEINHHRKWFPCQAFALDPGGGKTHISAEEITDFIKAGRSKHDEARKLVIYAVPTHKLANEVKARFEALGVDAQVWKGRSRPLDDSRPDGASMCANLENIDAAIELGLKTYEAVCKSEQQECVFFQQCSYVAQMQKKPDVWIVIGDMLFVAEESFEGANFIFIDESFVLKGLRGIDDEKSYSVPLEALEREDADDDDRLIAARDTHRRKLAAALRLQEIASDDDDDGGVELDVLDRAAIDIDMLNEALSLEWKARNKILLPKLEMSQLGEMSKSELGNEIKLANKMTKIYGELQHIVRYEIRKSGRVRLKMRDGAQIVTWRGVEQVRKPFHIPTMLMDAMLPGEKILRAYYPQVEVLKPIRIKIPSSVHIRQIIDAPSTTTKMKNAERMKELRRLIIKHYLEVFCGDTLVVTQLAAEKWLKEHGGLPNNITVTHYNAISGLDAHKNVRLLMIIGRTLPGDKTIRAYAEALSGEHIPRVKIGEYGASAQWRYHKVECGIPLRDGGEVIVMNYALPHEMAEAVRQMICNDEQRQAIGRARWSRRDESTPLDIVIVSNEALMPVDEVLPWRIPSKLVETALQGVMLTTSLSDLAKLWPELWPNAKAAKWDLVKGVPELPGWQRVTYQRKGPKLKRQKACFDLGVIAEPQRWDGWDRLGGLAFFALDAPVR